MDLKSSLGEAGLTHFRELKKKYGTVNACYDEGGIPHITHFREGMWVRNRLREIYPNMGDHWYDDNWVELVEEAIL